MNTFRRSIALVVAVAFSLSAGMQAAQANLISTEEVAQAQPAFEPAEALAQRGRLLAALDRADVAQGLAERGVSAADAKARVAAMTDSEVAMVNQQLDTAPAGGDVLGVLLTVFLVLLVTDILGLTKVFPFTRSIRH